jgi:hypothetical protein
VASRPGRPTPRATTAASRDPGGSGARALTKETAAVLRVWLAERGSPPAEPPFPTSTGKPLARKALARRIAKHAAHAAHAAERCPC